MPRRNKISSKYPELRRHTNTDGRRKIQNGGCKADVIRIARKLGIPYKEHTQKGN